jgi:hypothetical protein
MQHLPIYLILGALSLAAADRDPLTGVESRPLAPAPARATNLYYHFSNFTADDRFVILAVDGQVCAYELAAGRLERLTGGEGVAAAAAAPHPSHPDLIYYWRQAALIELNLATRRERRVGEAPPALAGGYGQPTFSPDLRRVTLAFQRDGHNWEIGLMELATGAYRRVLTQGFRIGHVQHHPKEDKIFYVWETGGYAPQRTWLVNADGSANRPFYARTDPKTWFTPLKEWVTHEAWISGTGGMTLILDKAGILVAGSEGEAQLLPGDYWHVAARADGKVLVADDNPGNLWLIETATGNRKLLVTNLRGGKRVHAHASFSRNGRYVIFNDGRQGEGVSLIDLHSIPGEGWWK